MKKLLSLFLAFAMVFSTFPDFVFRLADDIYVYEEYFSEYNEQEKYLPYEIGSAYIYDDDLIRVILTSAIDDTPFVAYFDTAAGRMSLFYMDGESIGVQYLYDEEEFWELVKMNREEYNSYINK